MKSTIMPALALLIGVSVLAGPVLAQKDPKEPKNTVSQVKKARRHNHYQKQVLVSPKKSPGKHADNLSKNVNHELNRESKDVNHFFQGKK